MKITKELEAEIRAMMDDYWGSYFRGDLEHWQSYLVDDYRNIGGTEEEIWNSKQEIVEYTHRVIDQMAGLTELRNMQRQIIPYDGYLMVHEFTDIFIRIEEKWTFYGKFRLSSLIQKIADTWKVLHQHGSYPDSHTEQGEAFAFDTLRKENTQLREAVKRRTVELENKNHELKIEAAVERVRARAMAMHNSNELNEVVSVLFEKLKELQIPFTAVGIATSIEGSKDLNAFVCGQNEAGLVITNYRLPYFDNPIPKDLHRALEKQLDFFVGHYSKEEKDAFYEYVIEHTAEFRHLPEDIKRMIFDSTTYTISMVAVKNAVFNINDFEGKVLAEHEIDIIKRFARVFDQAYTRFLDLKKAEAQAREARIESSLEKVRSRTMAMQKGEELKEVAVFLYKELIALGVTNFVTCGYVEIDENINRQYTWVTAPGGDTLGLFYLPLTGDATFDERYAAWKRQQVIFHQTVAGEVRSNHLEYAITTFNSKEAEEMVRSQFPDPTVFYCFNFSHGYLHIVTGSELKEEEELLLARFTRVFEQAYTRFLDLQKAEEQAGLIREERDRLEIALNELHATQDQLVQQEKLASLGQLTAGIAHEIKNPLNFVNNFSDVSLEMIDEALEELQQIGENEHAAETAAILADIKSNLSKIHEHGSRADGIVKSMLQHSRGGDGKMEPTLLNPLIEEYVNLTFHGMRAGNDPVSADIDMQLDESVGEVPLIAEDFSRVILNICNNGFDAMRTLSAERSALGESYNPKLIVRTKNGNDRVSIEIEDNGPGIPDDIKDKIMQPFFTTKKGTQGTGLGLSITNDIVKAHGGVLNVSTQAGKRTTFTIELPK